MAICCEGVFRRYKGVFRLEVNVERQAGPRNAWMRSAWPYLPSPKSRMHMSLDNAEVQALLVGTGVTLGVDGNLTEGLTDFERKGGNLL